MTVGRVYKISAPGCEQVYVGSTCQALKQRLGQHRSDMTDWLAGERAHITSFRILAHEDATIELLEEVEFTDKSVLHQREAYWIGQLPAVNRYTPTGLPQQPWNQYMQQYRRTHPRSVNEKEKTRLRNKERVTCPTCNLSLRRDALLNHTRRKHQ